MSATSQTPTDVLQAYLDEGSSGPSMTQMNVYVPKETKRLIATIATRLSWTNGKVVTVATEMLEAALDARWNGNGNGPSHS